MNANPRALAAANQLPFRMAKKKVSDWFEDRGLVIQSEIFIYPEYPDSWEAVVACIDRVWIMRSDRGYLHVRDIQHVRGFRENGALIFS